MDLIQSHLLSFAEKRRTTQKSHKKVAHKSKNLKSHKKVTHKTKSTKSQIKTKKSNTVKNTMHKRSFFRRSTLNPDSFIQKSERVHRIIRNKFSRRQNHKKIQNRNKNKVLNKRKPITNRKKTTPHRVTKSKLKPMRINHKFQTKTRNRRANKKKSSLHNKKKVSGKRIIQRKRSFIQRAMSKSKRKSKEQSKQIKNQVKNKSNKKQNRSFDNHKKKNLNQVNRKKSAPKDHYKTF